MSTGIFEHPTAPSPRSRLAACSTAPCKDAEWKRSTKYFSERVEHIILLNEARAGTAGKNTFNEVLRERAVVGLAISSCYLIRLLT